MTDEKTTLLDLMDDMPIAMLTTTGADGSLRSVPMARQEVDPSAELWFITARDTRHVADIEARPHVALTFASRSSWVAVEGRAEVVDDTARLRDLWTTFADAWLPGGPDDPNAVLLRVDVTGGEYWDTPGGTVTSLLSLLKTKVTGETYDTDHGSTSL